MRRHEVPVAATGILRQFAEAGMLHPVDFHLARRMTALTGSDDPTVELACALTVRELRLGSVCLDLATAHTLLPEVELDDGSAAEPVALPWPEPTGWLAAVAASPAVAGPHDLPRPFRLSGSLLYLERYWAEERQVEAALLRRRGLAAPAAPLPVRLGSDGDQDDAVESAVANLTTVITGGPGTGKTTTVGRILDALGDQEKPPYVALAAPTGKAATRLHAAVAAAVQHPERLRLTPGTTLHSLLGAVPGKARPHHRRDNPLPHDVVIIDETSMVSLSMMAWLLEAVADTTRLVLIGDPFQLASVEAGAVLADIASNPALVDGGARPGVVRLGTNHRSNQAVTEFAEAIHAGDAERCLALLQEDSSVSFHEFTGAQGAADYPVLRADLQACAAAVVHAARNGDGEAANRALEEHRILCAHREGPFGIARWGAMARNILAADDALGDYGGDREAYVGQPLLITRNSDLVSNGDTAVVVERGGRLVACVDRAEGPLYRDPMLLEDRADLHAMTVHKSQGSQFVTVSVVLPPVGSPLLTRELFYTAVTRARENVRIYGSLDALAAAVATPARRASGLGR